MRLRSWTAMVIRSSEYLSTYVRTCTYTHIHTDTHIYTLTFTYLHIHTHTHIYTLSHLHTFPNTHICTHIHTHTRHYLLLCLLVHLLAHGVSPPSPSLKHARTHTTTVHRELQIRILYRLPPPTQYGGGDGSVFLDAHPRAQARLIKKSTRNISTYPSIYLSIYLSIYPSIFISH